MSDPCPDLEVLFTEMAEGAGPAVEHSRHCQACTAVLAAHREMERELFHLSDPLPPSGFVPAVMARVATAPTPIRREVWAGLSVLFGSVSAAGVALFARPGGLGHVGVSAAGAARNGMALASGLGEGLTALWHHAALPMTALLGALLLTSLFGLKKLAGTPALSDLKVSP